MFSSELPGNTVEGKEYDCNILYEKIVLKKVNKNEGCVYVDGRMEGNRASGFLHSEGHLELVVLPPILGMAGMHRRLLVSAALGIEPRALCQVKTEEPHTRPCWLHLLVEDHEKGNFQGLGPQREVMIGENGVRKS